MTGKACAQHANVSAGSCSLLELFSRYFRPSSRRRQRLFVLRTASCVPTPLCNAHQNKARLQSRQEFVFSSEATSCRDASQGVCIRYFHSVTPPLLQNQTHTFCSCQSLWQRRWHQVSETSSKLLTATLCPGNRRPVGRATRCCLPALQGWQPGVPESPARPQPSVRPSPAGRLGVGGKPCCGRRRVIYRRMQLGKSSFICFFSQPFVQLVVTELQTLWLRCSNLNKSWFYTSRQSRFCLTLPELSRLQLPPG